MTPSNQRIGGPKRPNLKHTKSPSSPSPLRSNSEKESNSRLPSTPLPNRPGNARTPSSEQSGTSLSGTQPFDDSPVMWPLQKGKKTWPKGIYWRLCHQTSRSSEPKPFSYARLWFTHLEQCKTCQSLLRTENAKHRRCEGEYWTPCHGSSHKKRRGKPFKYARCWLEHLQNCSYCSKLSFCKQTLQCRDGEYWSLCSNVDEPFTKAHQWLTHLESCKDCQSIQDDEKTVEWPLGEYYTLCGGKNNKPLPYARCWLEHLENCDKCERILETHRTYPRTNDDSPPTLKRTLTANEQEVIPAEEKEEEDSVCDDFSEDDSEAEDWSKPVLDPPPNPSQSTHRKIQGLLRKKLPDQDRWGFIYILHNLEDGLRKVGRAGCVFGRMGKYASDCKIKVSLIRSLQVKYYKRTEKLIHAELSEFCRPFSCEVCGKTHGEWFEVDEKVAVASVEKWVHFMQRNDPYHEESKELTPFWANRIVLREASISFGNLTNKFADFDSLQKYWAEILTPTSYDHHIYKIQTFRRLFNGNAFQSFLWKVNGVAAWTVAAVFSHQYNWFLTLFAMVSCILVASGLLHNYQIIQELEAALVRKKR